MAATPSSTKEPSGIGRGRPLSTAQLLTSDKNGEGDEEEGDDEKHNRKRNNENLVGRFSFCQKGIENGGFELGSPIIPQPPTAMGLEVINRQSKVSFREFRLSNGSIMFENHLPPQIQTPPIATQQNDNNNHHRHSGNVVTTEMTNRQSLEISNGNVQQSENLQTMSTVTMENSNLQTSEERDAGSDLANVNINRSGRTTTIEEGTEGIERFRGVPVDTFGRASWLLDGNVKRRDDTVWRRRKTDPSGDLCPNYSYHRDYQEALSSLLWEPYECRQPENSPQQSAIDDGNTINDASMWLYPRILRPARDSDDNNAQYAYRANVANCQLSSSSSTSSMSSSSSSAAIGAMALAEEGNLWKRSDKDPSNSSLKALILSSSTSKEDDLATPLPSSNNGCELRSGPVDGDTASSCSSSRIGNVTNDPNQEEEEDADAVSDLHKRCVGTVPPLGALQEQCEFCWLDCSQCEAVNSIGSAMLDPPSVSASVVTTCCRAVPVVVSSVPAIPCNVSNIHIGQTPPPPPVATRARTFTSTEAQTDDIGVGDGIQATSPSRTNNNREHRRRERRERRHQRRLHQNPEPLWQTQVAETPPVGERLPDILNSHLPPPYSTLPLGLPPPGHVVHPHLHHPPPPPPVPPPVSVAVPPPVAVPVTSAAPGSPPPHHPHHGGMRFPFQITPGNRRRSRRSPRGQHYTPEEEPKSCCGVVVTQTVSIRWFIVMIAFVGICCAVVGTVLGAMKASGREHLTVSLLMIGVGIVLITVSGVAWRLTAHDAPSCRMMLGLGGGDEGGAEPNRRFVPRLPPSYGRPHHPYAAMMYPEFQYRPPPPSYQASMQEYRLRLLLLDRHPGTVVPGQAPGGHAVSPPPTYRSHAGSMLRAPLGVRRDQPQSDYSRPPSYRSRTSSTRPTLDPNGNTGCSTAEHSRDPSLSLSESGGGSAVVNVISVISSGVPDPEPLDSIKLVGLPADHDVPLRMMLNKGGCHSSGNVSRMESEGKDANLVTIVQTGNDSSPVIVTVSGSTMVGSTSQQPGSGIVDTEMEILAHL